MPIGPQQSRSLVRWISHGADFLFGLELQRELAQLLRALRVQTVAQNQSFDGRVHLIQTRSRCCSNVVTITATDFRPLRELVKQMQIDVKFAEGHSCHNTGVTRFSSLRLGRWPDLPVQALQRLKSVSRPFLRRLKIQISELMQESSAQS